MTGPSTIIFSGVDIGDDTFETDPAIVGYSIMWNISRIKRDADLGKFGPPVIKPMSVFPPMSPRHTVNVDWRKVNDMRHLPKVLDIPVLQLCYGGAVHIVDGNKRISARRLNGMPDFTSYVVPETQEREYRIAIIVDDREITPSELGGGFDG